MHNLFKGQAVLFIHRQQERREHNSQHEKHRPGIAEGATGQQIGRNPHRARAAEADKLAFGEVESHLCFDFG